MLFQLLFSFGMIFGSSLAEGKQRMLQLETIRQDRLTLADILLERHDAFEWYQSVN